MVANWLMKSDIKNIEGSEDIIKAICGEEVCMNFNWKILKKIIFKGVETELIL